MGGPALTSGAQSDLPRGDTGLIVPTGRGVDERKREAGTQALPVDTNPREAISLTATSAGTVVDEDRQPLKPNPEWYRGVDALTGHESPPQNPRFDKKAWMREYMRDHRKGILRRPKPTTKREKDE